ncbi:MAG: methylated-DNA--[protein]-cysteine S-methyltransferase [Hahellaceae bacterium]|nr:methylated-DNA--[protein]-cysteine S-methyltransferase [Hahellaceae bacterium]
MNTAQRNYARIAKAITYFSRHQQEQPGLTELAQEVGVSEFHLQRLFTEWVGVSPKKFLQYLTKERAKQALRQSTVLDAALSVGLSGVGRLHDLMLTCEGITPGDYKRLGAGLNIRYGLHDSPFGPCLLATNDRGVCKLAFYDTEQERSLLIDELQMEWPEAQIVHDTGGTHAVHEKIFPDRDTPSGSGQRLHLLMKGSPFQLRVWEALLKVPEGNLVSYADVAVQLGEPNAVRAVASAIARNHLGYLIPCHRVIRQTGDFNQYRWGAPRKMAIIGWEASQLALRNQ